MKSWRFPETRQGENMRNIYDHQGSAKRKRDYFALLLLLMAEFHVCNHVVHAYGEIKNTIYSSKIKPKDRPSSEQTNASPTKPFLDMPKRLDTHLVVEAFTDLYACRGESHGS
jgi:hypothetical protein